MHSLEGATAAAIYGHGVLFHHFTLDAYLRETMTILYHQLKFVNLKVRYFRDIQKYKIGRHGNDFFSEERGKRVKEVYTRSCKTYDSE